MMYEPVKIPRQVGAHVRRRRETWGMTRARLAKAAGVSERLIASLELGEAPGIRLDKLMAVLGALDMQLGISVAIDSNDRESLPNKLETTRDAAHRDTPKTNEPSTPGEDPTHATILRQFIAENYGIPDEQVSRFDSGNKV